MLTTTKKILERASAENYGVAAPNVNYELDAKACIMAAEEANSPIILDIGFKARPDDMFDFGKVVRNLAEKSTVPVAICLDHGGELKQHMLAIQAGFTSLMVDRSMLPMEENIAQVKEIVDLAHSVGVTVEAELGHVGMADNYDVDRDAALTRPEDAARFIKETGVDCLAVAIGTAHGAYPKGFVPYLDFDRLVEIKKATNNFPLVLHGSSGTKEEDLRKVCRMGINKININNDICKAVVADLKASDLEGGKAYGVYNLIFNSIKTKLIQMIDIYGSTGKAWKIDPIGVGKTLGTLAE